MKQLKHPDKPIFMVITKQDHLAHENETWHRELEFLKQENALLKTRLSVILDTNGDKDFIKLAEYFQNQFLLKDEVIDKLEINLEQHQGDIKDSFYKYESADDIVRRQEKFRKEINYFETDFSRLKNEFHQLIAEYL